MEKEREEGRERRKEEQGEREEFMSKRKYCKVLSLSCLMSIILKRILVYKNKTRPCRKPNRHRLCHSRDA